MFDGAAKAGLYSLTEPWIDMTLPADRMVVTLFDGIDEFDRELLHPHR